MTIGRLIDVSGFALAAVVQLVRRRGAGENEPAVKRIRRPELLGC